MPDSDKGDRGSCTFHAISAHAATEQPASAQKPMRHDQVCTSHANGVPVASSPTPPMLSTVPDIAANRAGSKRRAMKTVHARNAGAQPTPINTWPSTNVLYDGARADSTAPATASGKPISTVRRTPCRSMPMPTKSCMAPNAK
jgi:hypothetical protein